MATIDKNFKNILSIVAIDFIVLVTDSSVLKIKTWGNVKSKF